MKIIDLLNKIANGEEVPKKIKYKNDIYKYFYNDKNYIVINYYICLFDEDIMQILNDEVEITEDTPKEDKKIEKIKDYSIMTTMGLDSKLQERKISKDIKLKEVVDKMNEIIDKLNGDE